MARESNAIQIDSEKIRKELKRRGLNMRQASLEMGRSAGYLKTTLSKGIISVSSMMLIEHMYGIKQADVEIKKAEEVKEPEKQPDIDYDKIYEVIYTAVYHAVKQAWKDA